MGSGKLREVGTASFCIEQEVARVSLSPMVPPLQGFSGVSFPDAVNGRGLGHKSISEPIQPINGMLYCVTMICPSECLERLSRR
jgi:hypothetical protein